MCCIPPVSRYDNDTDDAVYSMLYSLAGQEASNSVEMCIRFTANNPADAEKVKNYGVRI